MTPSPFRSCRKVVSKFFSEAALPGDAAGRVGGEIAVASVFQTDMVGARDFPGHLIAARLFGSAPIGVQSPNWPAT